MRRHVTAITAPGIAAFVLAVAVLASTALAAPNETTLVSRADGADGEKGNQTSFLSSVSANGRYVVFTSFASNLDPDDHSGAAWNDTVRGGGGDDRIFGREGDDGLSGNAGDDVIFGGLGEDRVFGRGGDDRLFALDGERDLVGCGDGEDRAVVDRADTVRSCEDPRRAAPARR